MRYATLPVLFVVVVAFAPTVMAIWFVKRGASKVWLVLGLVWAFLELAIGLPSAVPARSTAQKNACIANLTYLAEAKARWAAELKPEASAFAKTSDLAPFLKSGFTPACPAGGTYTLGAVNEPPRCSHFREGHALTPPR